MDRTNWQYGKKHINVLTIGINVCSVCVPLVWKVLPQSTKSGNSNTKHRKTIITKLLKVLPSEDIMHGVFIFVAMKNKQLTTKEKVITIMD